MIMRTPASRACRPASIALARSCLTPASTSARLPWPLPPTAATADSVAPRVSAAVSAWNSPVFPFGVMSRTPLSTMRRISRACASQSTCPSGPNGVTGIAATVASAPRSWSAAPGSKLIGIPSGWPRPPLAPTLGHDPGTSRRGVTEGSFADVAHDVLDAGVVLEPVHGQVLAVPGVLEAAMGHLGHERNMGVDPDRPEVELPGHPHRPAVILRPHAGGQPVLDPVRPAQRLLLSRETLHGDHRAEDLLLDHLV